ncbi:proton-conducting transporter transmembrane domain-containing protein [Mucilaginibacter flavidus]|uniref:proton-conducting transporter transmembrane domain-containing protein n=1 Tax=Mucilaginibacter flavidus TaxID=2949309 RepID=UPI0020932653|nr:proton-conducting transporter membrane subunit [Mucilaginibacter flavidus]MCO5947990.1 pesticidal protein Cry28Aa [Mucilaginibacter flavidus]
MQSTTNAPSTNVKHLKKPSSHFFNQLISIFLSVLCLSSIALLTTGTSNNLPWRYFGIFKINGFTLLIWSVVSFFSAIVSVYSATYLMGFRYHSRFTALCLGFTLSVMIFIASDHIVAILPAWLMMGFFMARLIGVVNGWHEARKASGFAQRYFLCSGAALSAGVLILAFASNNFTLSGITAELSGLSNAVLVPSALLIITAALVQSAIYPFHRWLLSAMTAPTPASALMHAGFVNGSGILLTMFASLLLKTETLSLLFVIGGITAIVAQFAKLLQTSIKQKLACSTIAQMGFMIMQCGLGFFNAAVTHLILHGFYKAYLFLSSGEQVQASAPGKPLPMKIRPLQAIAVLITGILGAACFAVLTGKATAINSGIFLTLVVAITVGQATYNIVKQRALSVGHKIYLPLLLFSAGICSYALIYNGVSRIMRDIPDAERPMLLSPVQILFGVIFLSGFLIMKFGIYKKWSWLYVNLLNATQPYKKTILLSKNQSL